MWKIGQEIQSRIKNRKIKYKIKYNKKNQL